MNVSQRQRAYIKNVLIHIALCILVFLYFFPILWMFISCVKVREEIFSSTPIFIPSKIDFSNFERLFSLVRVPTYFKNSVIIATGSILLSLAVSIPSAYCLTRYDFRGKKLFAYGIILLYMVPGTFFMVPLFVLFSKFGLINTYLGLIMAHCTFSIPFNIWMLWQFFRGIPTEPEEAALVFGANGFQAFFYVFLPLAIPGIVSTSIFSFIVSWNNYLLTLSLTMGEMYKTLPLAMTGLLQLETVDWGMAMALGAIISLPPMLAFSYLQKYLVKGFTIGAVEE